MPDRRPGRPTVTPPPDPSGEPPDGVIEIRHYASDRIEIASGGGVKAWVDPSDLHAPMRLVFSDGCNYQLQRMPWQPAGWSADGG